MTFCTHGVSSWVTPACQICSPVLTATDILNQRDTNIMTTKYCNRCRKGEGWLCEIHPNKHWPHDDCPGPGMPCVNGCNPLSPKKVFPYCCFINCPKAAEFSIHGASGHFEDVTEACEDHIGALLGTPTWLEKENKSWSGYPMETP